MRVGIVFAAFPADTTPYIYFLLLLNRLQKTCEFEIFDCDPDDPYIEFLEQPVKNVDGDRARDELRAFGLRTRHKIETMMNRFDLATALPAQLIIVTGVTLSDNHYLIRRSRTSLLALGEWDSIMAPPSLAEFLQLLVLRAAYSAVEGEAWNSIHAGSRACIFDFTENLGYARYMALAGVGVCADCAHGLDRDGFANAAREISHIALGEWTGSRREPGTPAHVMARLRSDLYLTGGFKPTFRERLIQAWKREAPAEFIKLLLAAAAGALLALVGFDSDS